MRLLIVSCSKRKRSIAQGERVIAGELYDGVAFRTVTAWKRQHPSAPLLAVILSAKFGLISWDATVAPYDMRMTKTRAAELRGDVLRTLVSLPARHITDVYVELGKDYLEALPDISEIYRDAHVVYGRGRIGSRLRHLRAWLDAPAMPHGRHDGAGRGSKDVHRL